MIFISKKFTKTISAIFIGLVLAFGASYVSALTARPADINTNAPDAIDTSSTSQTKGDPGSPSYGQISLKQFLGGFVSNTTCASDDSTDYTLINENGAMSIGRCLVGSGITLDIKGKTGVKGTIRALRLAHTEDAKVPVCADVTGALTLCGETLEYTEPGVYGIYIPRGVTSINVSMYGAGGSGYGTANAGSSNGDGEESFFKGNGISIQADGGKGAKGADSYGLGGSVSVNGVGIDVITQANGGDGENPPSFNDQPISVKTGTCYSTNYYLLKTNYYLLKGGTGNVGGKGGAPYQGDKVNGGSGGEGGPLSGSGWSFTNGDPDAQYTTLNCVLADTTSDGNNIGNSNLYNNRPGGDGVDAPMSGGGSGFGGKGGVSALIDNQICSGISSNPNSCYGGDSGAGGGAGAYVNANVDVSSGQVFYIKVGKGGEPKMQSCIGQYCERDQLGGGALSGKGGNGKVVVSYNYNS